MKIIVKQLTEENLLPSISIWNEVVEEGRAFPQEELLGEEEGRTFFAQQSYTGVALDEETGEVVGMYILHPNNVGRCGHICNASYAIKRGLRGQHIGAYIVQDCIKQGGRQGFKVLQFNAVVASNTVALKLYKKMGFTQLGVIPQGFRNIEGKYEDIIPHYILL